MFTFLLSRLGFAENARYIFRRSWGHRSCLGHRSGLPGAVHQSFQGRIGFCGSILSREHNQLSG